MAAGLRASTTRRLLPIIVGAVLLAGCNVPSNAPEAYDEQVERDFLIGCTGGLGEVDGTTTTLARPDDCQCAYDVFVATVPYDDEARADPAFAGYPEGSPVFTSLDKDLGSDPSAIEGLPASVREELAACIGGGTGPTPVASGEPSAATSDS